MYNYSKNDYFKLTYDTEILYNLNVSKTTISKC